MMIQVDPTVARTILQVAQELRDLATQAPYLADRAPYAAGQVLAAAEKLDLLAGSRAAPTPPAPKCPEASPRAA